MTEQELMRRALELARQAQAEGEIPVGAVIARNGEIVAEGRNDRERAHSALGHAEIRAIDAACRRLGRWRLNDCELYVTLEPCPMCAGAVLNSRIEHVWYGTDDPKSGCAG